MNQPHYEIGCFCSLFCRVYTQEITNFIFLLLIPCVWAGIFSFFFLVLFCFYFSVFLNICSTLSFNLSFALCLREGIFCLINLLLDISLTVGNGRAFCVVLIKPQVDIMLCRSWMFSFLNDSFLHWQIFLSFFQWCGVFPPFPFLKLQQFLPSALRTTVFVYLFLHR